MIDGVKLLKILHTSDWHLGQTLRNKSREREHQLFINWLLEQIDEHKIDAVIIAGDVFDTGSPPSYARTMYNDFTLSLKNQNCQLLVLGGNHDSVSVLQETANIVHKLGTTVIGGVLSNPTDQVVTFKSSNNKLSAAVVCAIPFIRPRDVTLSKAGEDGNKKRVALLEGMVEHFNKVYAEAVIQRDKLTSEIESAIPIIATGHLTTLPKAKTKAEIDAKKLSYDEKEELISQKTEAMRDIYVGSLNHFPVSNFPPADYTALGHIHKPMIVSSEKNIRYSGSPIHLSFDELGYQKEVVLLEFDGLTTTPTINSISVPVFQPMFVVTGDFEKISTKLRDISNNHSAEHPNCPPAWAEVIIDTNEYVTDFNLKIKEITDNSAVEVLRCRRKNQDTAPNSIMEQKESLAELKPLDVFQSRLEQESLSQEVINRLTLTFNSVMEEVLKEEAQIEDISPLIEVTNTTLADSSPAQKGI